MEFNLNSVRVTYSLYKTKFESITVWTSVKNRINL